MAMAVVVAARLGSGRGGVAALAGWPLACATDMSWATIRGLVVGGRAGFAVAAKAGDGAGARSADDGGRFAGLERTLDVVAKRLLANQKVERKKRKSATHYVPIQPPGFDAITPNKLRPQQPEAPRVVYVAVVGAPNVGKSTLVNRLVGEKVSIVSRKRNTTREAIMGIFTHDNTQVILLDTPGIVPTENISSTDRDVVIGAWRTLHHADVAAVMVDAVKKHHDHEIDLVKRIQEYKIPSCLLLNKSDLVPHAAPLLEVAAKFKEVNPNFEHIYPISALKGEGMETVRKYMLSKSKPAPWPFHKQQVTDQSDLRRAEELIRERVLDRLHEEIPYRLGQQTVGWTDLPNGGLRIDHEFICDTLHQKKMIIGEQGTVLNTIREAAQENLSKLFGRPVFLYITVRSRK